MDGKTEAYFNGVKKATGSQSFSIINEYNGIYTLTVEKNGKFINLTQNIGQYSDAYSAGASCPELEYTPVHEIVFVFAKYGTKPALGFNGIFDVKFVKNNCDTWRNVPNKFTANDKLIADCGTGKIYLNGIDTPRLGALGNNWEDFYLNAGKNTINIAYSDWVTEDYAPTFKLRYREVFL